MFLNFCEICISIRSCPKVRGMPMGNIQHHPTAPVPSLPPQAPPPRVLVCMPPPALPRNAKMQIFPYIFPYLMDVSGFLRKLHFDPFLPKGSGHAHGQHRAPRYSPFNYPPCPRRRRHRASSPACPRQPSLGTTKLQFPRTLWIFSLHV